LNNISTTKSPIQILASAIQVYLPKNINTNKKINIISITPCVAKKYEPTLFKNDVKISITTRQFAD
jgi:iron only hydrogenase large subunit-like protein